MTSMQHMQSWQGTDCEALACLLTNVPMQLNFRGHQRDPDTVLAFTKKHIACDYRSQAYQVGAFTA
jgi:hypothetical protein